MSESDDRIQDFMPSGEPFSDSPDLRQNQNQNGQIIQQLMDRIQLLDRLVAILDKRLMDVWPPRIDPPADEADSDQIDIQITGHVQDGSSFRWKYAWSQVAKTVSGFGGWTTVSDGLSGTTSANIAYNTIEDGNGSTGLMGNGVDTENFPDGGTFAVQPVPSGRVVQARRRTIGTTVEYHFQYENGVDGACPS